MKTDQKIHPIYFIYGTEELLMEEEIQGLLDRTLGPKEKGLNYHVFSAEEHTPQEIVEAAHRHFPHLTILSRARGRAHAYELIDAGIERIYRETLDSSLRDGVDALRLLGRPAHATLRAARRFRRHDEESVRELAALRHDRGAYLSRARESIEDLERLLADEVGNLGPEADAAWDTETLRREFGKP